MGKRPRLAYEGGEKSRTISTSEKPKLDLEELMELIDLWGFKGEGREEIKSVLERYWKGGSPHLFRYYHPDGISRTQRFEKEFAKLFDVPYVLGVNSATSALITANAACEVGPGCEVIVPAFTFFASAASIVAAKAIPVIAEVDDSLTIDPNDVADKVTPQTKAIIVVHMRGLPVDMDSIMEIASENNLCVIEDVAQADGGWYKGKRLGTIGDVGCFSLDFLQGDNQW